MRWLGSGIGQDRARGRCGLGSRVAARREGGGSSRPRRGRSRRACGTGARCSPGRWWGMVGDGGIWWDMVVHAVHHRERPDGGGAHQRGVGVDAAVHRVVRVAERGEQRAHRGHTHERVRQRVQEEPAARRDVPPGEMWGDMGRYGEVAACAGGASGTPRQRGGGWASRATRRARRLHGSESLRPSRPGHGSTVSCASLSIRAPRSLATEAARDHGREDEAVEQREQHEEGHVRREGLHAQRHHAPARAQRVLARGGVMRRPIALRAARARQGTINCQRQQRNR